MATGRDDCEREESDSPSFSKLFYSVKEQVDPIEAKIKGSIPAWLDGSLLRNGPGKFEVGSDTYEHWFDGLAILHRFNIHEGMVTYQSRYLRSDSYNTAVERNRIVMSEFGTVAHPDPCLGYFGRLLSRFVPRTFTDNCNINLAEYGDELYAVTEGTLMRKVDPANLETHEKVNLADRVALHSATSHPHTARDGTVYNMGSRFSLRSSYNIVKIPPRNNQETTCDPYCDAVLHCSIPASGFYPSFFHSFAITDNYIIFVEQPTTLNLLKIMYAQFFMKSYMISLDYQKSRLARFHVIQRETGELLPQVYTSDAFFSFHHINAYEESGHVVVDMCVYEDGSIINAINLKGLRDGVKPTHFALAKRFAFPVGKEITRYSQAPPTSSRRSDVIMKEDGSLHCQPSVISDTNVELPRINYESHNGRPYRYFYCTGGNLQQTLLKVDTHAVTSRAWFEEGCFPSEPVYINSPESSEEDDGVVVSSVVDVRHGNRSYLLVLDAREFIEIARAEIDAEISFGFHGMFLRGQTEEPNHA